MNYDFYFFFRWIIENEFSSMRKLQTFFETIESVAIKSLSASAAESFRWIDASCLTVTSAIAYSAGDYLVYRANCNQIYELGVEDAGSRYAIICEPSFQDLLIFNFEIAYSG